VFDAVRAAVARARAARDEGQGERAAEIEPAVESLSTECGGGIAAALAALIAHTPCTPGTTSTLRPHQTFHRRSDIFGDRRPSKQNRDPAFFVVVRRCRQSIAAETRKIVEGA
jgi:hypothetical protein